MEGGSKENLHLVVGISVADQRMLWEKLEDQQWAF
jgi:hypothetical protein